MNNFFATVPRRLLAPLLVFVLLGGSVRAADVVDNWSFLDLGAPPPKTATFGALGIPLSFAGFRAGGVVDAHSSPANPFPGTNRALYVEPTPDNGQLRIRTRPFLTENPQHGYYEFTFRILEGSFYLSVGVITLPWNPKDELAYAENERLFALNFNSGDPLACGKLRALVTEETSAIAPEENYTLRIEWKPADNDVAFRFFLNGKPVLKPGGEPLSLPVDRKKFDEGVLGFLLASGQTDLPCAKVFIGSLRAEALVP